MLKTSYSVVLMLAVAGCGGATTATNTDAPETTSSAGNRATGGGPNTKASGTAVGGAHASAPTKATGGAKNSGVATQGFAGGNLSKDSSSKGGATSGTQVTGGSSAGRSTGAGSSIGIGGVAVAGAFGAGGSTGGGVAAAGAFNAGGSAGSGTSDCVPVCPLYGAPCCLWQTACLRPTNGCTIDVLAASAGPTYQYDELESRVAALPQDVSASITTQDIAWAAADPWAASRIEIHLTDAAATRYAAVLDSAKDGRAFRVSCAGQSLFVGVFYLIYGAAALNTPVMHFARENGVSILRLGAYQSAWMGGPSTTEYGAARQRIDRIEMRADLCRRGVMHELDPDARPLNP